MTNEVKFHEAASEEFEAAFEWYYLRSEFFASKFAEEIAHAINLIAETPERWPKTNSGARKYLLRRFPCRL
jgi:plasmid stabilization system protein ParE